MGSNLGPTYDGDELIAAAVWQEASHGVPVWERGQGLLAVFMGLITWGDGRGKASHPGKRGNC